MIVEEIARYIDENEISRTYLSERTGMSEQMVKQSIWGKKKMSIEEYLRICAALGVSYEYFFNMRKDRVKKEFEFREKEKVEV